MLRQMSLGGSFTLTGSSQSVSRLGYGAMQLSGRDGSKLVWGPPPDVDGAIALLQEAVASGVNHIDTCDYYGPPHHQSDHTKGALPLSRRFSNRHQSRRQARWRWIVDSGALPRRADHRGSRQSSQSRFGCA